MPLDAGEYWALSDEQRAELNYPYYLEYARMLYSNIPEHFAALGETPEEYARAMTEPGVSIDEAVARGWTSAADGRLLQHRATLEDLLELGYTPEKAQAILLEQQERACASST